MPFLLYSLSYAQEFNKGQLLSKLKNTQINESSGMDISTKSDDLFFTHNDSGDTARFFAFNSKGDDLRTFTLKGAFAVDWEDMSSYKLDNQSYLMLCDVGDNLRVRPFYTLYVVKEPEPKSKELPIEFLINYKYEDGKQNCESVTVDANSKTVYIISKTKTGTCNLYSIPLKATAMITAKKIISLKLPQTTGMDISDDGLKMIISGYNKAYLYIRKENESWADACKRDPKVIEVPKRPQGESVCFSKDAKAFYLTSEFSNKLKACTLFKVEQK